MKKNKENNIRRFFFSLLGIIMITAPCLLRAGDIKLSLETEFTVFYDKNYSPPFSFQFRETKLFLDTYISEHSNALIEYVMHEDFKRAVVERAYFIQRDLLFNSQLTFGQFHSPFGYYNAFTVTRSMTKNVALSPDGILPAFKLRSVDTGVLWDLPLEPMSFSIAIVNGNNASGLRDDNNFKDFIGHWMYDFDQFQFGLNGYYGKKNSLDPNGTVIQYADVNVAAIGVETMVLFDKAVVAGEVIAQKYALMKSIGGYVMMNYDLSDLMKTLRYVSRFEIFNPNTVVKNNIRIQCAQGFFYTLDRGYKLKCEYILNIGHTKQELDKMFIELEYEL
ncbi:MAG: hypothetical protein AAB071_05465 [Bacteroidota bacterium]